MKSEEVVQRIGNFSAILRAAQLSHQLEAPTAARLIMFTLRSFTLLR